MNIHDEMSDDEVLRAAAGTLSALPVPEPPDTRAIMARGRTRRRRRLAGIGLAAAAAAAALGLASVLVRGPAPAFASGTIRTAAFTLVRNTNGTVALTLSQAQVFSPSALQQALARDGIPALVKVGTYCSSHPQPSLTGAISLRLPDGTPMVGTPVAGSTPGHPHHQIPADAVVVINPAVIPAGTELSFGYGNNGLLVGLIRTDSYTCVNGLPGA
jgi:hypothetical protein